MTISRKKLNYITNKLWQKEIRILKKYHQKRIERYADKCMLEILNDILDSRERRKHNDTTRVNNQNK